MSKKRNQKKELLTERQYKRRKKAVQITSKSLIGLTTAGGFFAYEMVIDWANFKSDIENFFVVQEETLQLNVMVAMPFLIGLIVFLIIMRKKNKEYFKDKVSIGVLIAILITYFFYSIAEAVLFSLIGAFVGTFIDEFGLTPIVNSYAKKEAKALSYEEEYDKEKIRISARKNAQEESREEEVKLNGSV